MKSIIDNKDLAQEGKSRMTWFRARMPLVQSLNVQMKDRASLKDKIIAICMHIEPKTAFWIEGLLAAGAKHIYLVGCIGTTKPDTAAYLASLDRVTVFGKKSDDYMAHQSYLEIVLKNKIDLFLDNGASLILAHHKSNVDWQPLGANEETRSGKLLIEKHQVKTKYPIIVIDDSPAKQLLENAIGVGQSVVDGFMRATSLLLGGKKVLVIGYGFCGSGVAKKFAGMGASVMVYDSDPIIRLKAKADGFEVGSLPLLIQEADVIITVTGAFDVITKDHIPYFKDKVILANAGHYNFEIDVKGLKEMATVSHVKDHVDLLTFKKKEIFLIADASPINLACGDGNPIEIMDLGLGLQSSSAVELIENQSLKPDMQAVPKAIDERICLDMLKILN